jgi:hypothetical protein
MAPAGIAVSDDPKAHDRCVDPGGRLHLNPSLRVHCFSRKRNVSVVVSIRKKEGGR